MVIMLAIQAFLFIYDVIVWLLYKRGSALESRALINRKLQLLHGCSDYCTFNAAAFTNLLTNEDCFRFVVQVSVENILAVNKIKQFKHLHWINLYMMAYVLRNCVGTNVYTWINLICVTYWCICRQHDGMLASLPPIHGHAAGAIAILNVMNDIVYHIWW
jgi:hypothetical protein